VNSEEQRTHWDLKYEQGLPSLTEADPFLISAYGQFVDQYFPNAGVALDLACGLGRHALWLASRHWRVSGVDVSDVAIGKLSQAALGLNVKIDLFVGDAAEYKFEPTRFDLVVLFYHLDRSLFPKMVSALKPGGLLICKMSLQWDPDGGLTGVSANPLGRNELPLLVPELHVLYQKERPVRGRGVVEFIGRKVGASKAPNPGGQASSTSNRIE
jgi:SAM-dependent methyltransferase